tara:strand:- start:11569 stop:12834 length:1266 start_codon:yes stop_codon:yes gene_type:complete
MELNIKTFLYIFLHLCPFILVCFFTISSIFGNDIKGIVYLVGLLLSIGLVIMSESIFPNLGDSWFNNDKQNAMCKLFAFGQSSLSNLSIGQIIIGFSFSYLVYTMGVVNKDDHTFASNWPTIVFFSLLVIAELGINTNIMTFIKEHWGKVIAAVVSIGVLIGIIYGMIALFSTGVGVGVGGGVGEYMIEHLYLMITNVMIIGYLAYQFIQGDTFKNFMNKISKPKDELGKKTIVNQLDRVEEDYCYEWHTSILTYIIAGGLGVGWAAIVSAFETPRLQYFNKGEKSDSCGKVKNDQFACKVYKNGDPNKQAITDESQCPLNGANNRLLEGVVSKTGFKEQQNTYTGISQANSLASGGTGATFGITVNADGDITDIVVDKNGKNYKKGDEITISKGDLGPSTKDLHIKIQSNRLLDCSQTVE